MNIIMNSEERDITLDALQTRMRETALELADKCLEDRNFLTREVAHGEMAAVVTTLLEDLCDTNHLIIRLLEAK